MIYTVQKILIYHIYIYSDLPEFNIFQKYSIIIKIRDPGGLACSWNPDSLETKWNIWVLGQELGYIAENVSKSKKKLPQNKEMDISTLLCEICIPCLKFASCIFNVVFPPGWTQAVPVVFMLP